MSIDSIHTRAAEAAAKLKACEIELLNALIEVDRRRVYTALGFSSLFKYTVECLGLSEELAYIFINVARKIVEVPALGREIERGHITVSKAKRISPVLNRDNQDHWLSVARSKSKRQLEREVALTDPAGAIPDKMRFVPASDKAHDRAILKPAARVQLQAGISEELMIQIRQIQDLVSRSRGENASLEQTLSAMAKNYLDRHDPVRRAQRQKIRGKLNEPEKQLGPGTVHRPQASRTPLSAATRHRLQLKSGGQCSYRDSSGKRCEQKRFLHIHHIRPISEGGTNDIENLEMLCSGHHKVRHYHERKAQEGS